MAAVGEVRPHGVFMRNTIPLLALWPTIPAEEANYADAR
jgi:hypothetical protein